MDEKQLSALIDAAVREAVERTTRELAAKHEADTEGLRRKRDELLNKVAKKNDEKPADDFDQFLARVDRQIASMKGQTVAPTTGPSSVREHTITRAEARSGERYRAAKAAAEKAGIPLRILDENAPPALVNTSPVRIIHDETGGILHVNKRLIDSTPGGLPRLRQLAAEKNAQLRLFKTVDDLPNDQRQRHAEVIASQDRSNLLGDDQ